MAGRKFVHRRYGKVEGSWFLFVSLLGAVLMAAGIEAYKHGDYDTAQAAWAPLASAGDSEAWPWRDSSPPLQSKNFRFGSVTNAGT
jgi:hypothetical protein